MQVYHDIKEVSRINDAIVTAGTYDGVHKGHQKILNRLLEIKKSLGGQTVVITYWPHPRKVVAEKSGSEKILYTLDERIELLKEYAIDHLLIINFTREFSQLSPDDYISRFLLEKIKTKKLIIGYDHRFGKNREGNFEYLVNNSQKFGFEVEEIPREDIESIGVSSSKIRKALFEGDIKTANLYLGKPFHLSGKVVKGEQRGRKMNFPTANISLSSDDKIIPKDGVYAVRVLFLGKMFNGMMNIGYRPTLEGKERTLEVNIFEFMEDIYDKVITVHFILRIRDEQKFAGLEELKNQLSVDKENSLRILNS